MISQFSPSMISKTHNTMKQNTANVIPFLYHPFNYGTPHQKERGDHALWKGKRLMRSHDRRGDTGFKKCIDKCVY
jgi:hypothetical protein